MIAKKSKDKITHQSYYYFQVTGQEMFSWTGRNGSEHWLTSLGNNSCNHGLPTLMEDSGFIRDKQSLPVTSFSYGPMPYESQNAKVRLGPLTCRNPDVESLQVSNIFYWRFFSFKFN